MEVSVNPAAVLVSAVLFFFLGSLWYSNMMFAQPWQNSVGITKETMEKRIAAGETNIFSSLVLMFASGLLMSYVLAQFIERMIRLQPKKDPFHVAVETAWWAWLGFIATYLIGPVAFESKSWVYYTINSGYWLCGMLMTGAIVGYWR